MLSQPLAVSIPVFCCLASAWAAEAGPGERLLPAVEAEESVYTYEPANNGAGPLWGNATTVIVRAGETVFASGLETLAGVKPLNNVRWLLYRRGAAGWERLQADPTGRTREPCPLGYLPEGRLLLSTNPTLTGPEAATGPARPEILELAAADPRAPGQVRLPVWDGTPDFSEHSYRSFAVDAPNREFILFQNVGYTHTEWTFCDRTGAWSAHGQLAWPWGAKAGRPEPIRVCYPAVALQDRAVYFLGVSDIVEPNPEWRVAKKAITGQEWDYDFRRLFLTWCPDITTGRFADWVEVASRETTCGWIWPCDLWVAPGGDVHVLWRERALDERLRPTFYPGEKQSQALNYAVLRAGRVVRRSTLCGSTEDNPGEVPDGARFQVTADSRLFVFYYVGGKAPDGTALAENRVLEIRSDGSHEAPVRVPLECPFSTFITATWRGGSPPSATLDVLGAAPGRPGIRYARVNLLNPVVADLRATVERTAGGARLLGDGSGSRSADGRVCAWEWDVGGAAATGATVSREFDRGGLVRVALTVRDDLGHGQAVTRTVRLPPCPADFGLPRWGLVLRTEAESAVAEGGGTAEVRASRPGSAGLCLGRWYTPGHWLEWEVDIPAGGPYALLVRYAAPEDATRALTLDGQPPVPLRFPATGGDGTETPANWGTTSPTGADGRPLPLSLTPGTHRLRLENGDGLDMAVDSLDWMAMGPDAATPTDAPPNLLPATDPDGFRYLVPRHGTVCPGQVRKEIGHCYTVGLGAHYPGDGMAGAPASTLRLFEDGTELGPAHVVHAEIRERGLGRHSHWVTTLYFSASDNSDPRTNGRVYTWRLEPQTGEQQ